MERSIGLVEQEDVVWVINIAEVKAYPRELQRIMTSPDIKKVGVGILNDVAVIWNDLRSELQGLVDAGLMARLLFAERSPLGGFGNLSLVDCAAEVLGFRVDKGEQIWCKRLALAFFSVDASLDAGTDAIVALRLYNRLVDALDARADTLGRDIPVSWYAFNSRMGEPMRLQKTIRGEEVPWSTKDCPWFFSGCASLVEFLFIRRGGSIRNGG
ncbi:hypothetical protein C8R46DRAFT_1024903 [Mycena filopes]|nr:hypothetical protein C8R46DRAFT_1024903 [Mycena filopes]